MSGRTEIDKADIWRQAHARLMEENLALKQQLANRPDEWQGGGTDRRRNPERVKELEKQLAAEREAGVKALAERSFELHECQKQLAAEREKFSEASKLALEQLSAEWQTYKEAMEDLRQQLAQEREKMRHVVALLENPKFDDWDRRELLKALHLTGAELAAERDAVKDWKAELQEQAAETVRVAEQLAAERESNDAQAAAYVRRINTLARAFESERHKREACEVLIRDLQKELAVLKR